MADCEVSLAPDNTVRCCHHMDRIRCQQDGFFTTFSIVGSCLGKRCCRRRFVFSEYRQRCVRIFRSGRGKTIATSETSETTTDTILITTEQNSEDNEDKTTL